MGSRPDQFPDGHQVDGTERFVVTPGLPIQGKSLLEMAKHQIAPQFLVDATSKSSWACAFVA